MQSKHKLIVVIVLCVCGIVLSLGLGWWILNHKVFGYSSDTVGVGQKKYVSWAMKVNLDSAKHYPITDVIDGDTIKVQIDGHVITVRMLGINTPEVLDPRKGVECFGPEASAETKKLLVGKSVLLALNPQYDRIDKYGRLLAYVRLPNTSDSEAVDLFVNEFLVKQGYAREYTFDSRKPYQYQVRFKADESEAKKAGKGLWGKCTNG